MNHTQIFIVIYFCIDIHITTSTKSMPGHMLNNLKSIWKSDNLLCRCRQLLFATIIVGYFYKRNHIHMHSNKHTCAESSKINAKKETLRTLSVQGKEECTEKIYKSQMHKCMMYVLYVYTVDHSSLEFHRLGPRVVYPQPPATERQLNDFDCVCVRMCAFVCADAGGNKVADEKFHHYCCTYCF